MSRVIHVTAPRGHAAYWQCPQCNALVEFDEEDRAATKEAAVLGMPCPTPDCSGAVRAKSLAWIPRALLSLTPGVGGVNLAILPSEWTTSEAGMMAAASSYDDGAEPDEVGDSTAEDRAVLYCSGCGGHPVSSASSFGSCCEDGICDGIYER